jgi:hypothetical protein
MNLSGIVVSFIDFRVYVGKVEFNSTRHLMVNSVRYLQINKLRLRKFVTCFFVLCIIKWQS